MLKSTFIVKKMDCPSEEQMIRMKLGELHSIEKIEVDIPKRIVTVYHSANPDEVANLLASLDLNSTLEETVSLEKFNDQGHDTSNESKLLWQVLIINFVFFLLELLTGYFARSIGLVADSLDMLADSIVYGLALSAIGGTLSRKKRIARIAGYFQIVLAMIGFVEVLRRFISDQVFPEYSLMISISVLALIGNGFCLYLLQKSKSKEIHIQASTIFTSNDVMVNLGVVLAGFFVYITNSGLPDLIIGTIVFFIVGRGSLKLLKLSR